MSWVRAGLMTSFIAIGIVAGILREPPKRVSASDDQSQHRDRSVALHALNMIDRGRNTFRYDTFGDQDFWSGTLQFHRAIEGQKLGGVGPGVDPATWQITPRVLTEALAAGGGEAKRAFEAMMEMKKIDIATIEAARQG